MISVTPKLSAREILTEQPNISKNELKECIKQSKKSKILGYTTAGMNGASSTMMLATGQTGFIIAGALLGIASLFGLYTGKAMSNVHKAMKEAYKIKYNA